MRSPHSTGNKPNNDREAALSARIARAPQSDRLEASARIAVRKLQGILSKPGLHYKDEVQFSVTILSEALQAMRGKR